MSQRLSSNRGRQKSGRSSTLLWVLASGIVIFLLLYYEQTAILYVLATLGLTTLLILVALADLKGTPTASELSSPNDDSAAIGTGISSTIPASATQARPIRPPKRK